MLMRNTSTITVLSDDRVINEIKSISVRDSLDVLISEFSIAIYNKKNWLKDFLNADKKIEIKVTALNNITELLLAGYADDISETISRAGNTATLNGGNMLLDITECAGIINSSAMSGAKLTDIISSILQPFNIELDSSELKTNPVIKKISVDTGEEAFSIIEKLCRIAAVLPVATPEGKLKLTYAASDSTRAVTDLVLGVNVEKLLINSDYSDVYSEYNILGQIPGQGKKWTKNMLQALRFATDETVVRYRPKIFKAENQTTAELLQERVNWEAQVRHGRSRYYTVTVSGWWQTDSNGEPVRLWRTNERVTLSIPQRNEQHELLITEVNFSKGRTSETAILTLRDPATYQAQPGNKIE